MVRVVGFEPTNSELPGVSDRSLTNLAIPAFNLVEVERIELSHLIFRLLVYIKYHLMHPLIQSITRVGLEPTPIERPQFAESYSPTAFGGRVSLSPSCYVPQICAHQINN